MFYILFTCETHTYKYGKDVYVVSLLDKLEIYVQYDVMGYTIKDCNERFHWTKYFVSCTHYG